MVEILLLTLADIVVGETVMVEEILVVWSKVVIVFESCVVVIALLLGGKVVNPDMVADSCVVDTTMLKGGEVRGRGIIVGGRVEDPFRIIGGEVVEPACKFIRDRVVGPAKSTFVGPGRVSGGK